MNPNKLVWHEEILPSLSSEVLGDLQRTLPLSLFYLGGGTGLALMFGHRLSRDFDFFSAALFDEEALIQKMQGVDDLTIVAKDEHTLHLTVKEIKVSLLGYRYSLLFETKNYHSESGISINVADERDIACMKMSAISSRGSKRDFMDLYIVAREYGLSELVTLFQKKFSGTPYNNVHLFKSLTYFADAETEPMPHMLIPLSWDAVKQFFTTEVPRLMSSSSQ